ncbi:hypothetical protein HBI56_062260 [Parastagonospora nodorum]|nr:hypothetical protein HBH53_125580 [Parastagonospora nodorum]KAH3969643.1 hypothetical protein HBH52_173580 [Parastagonospora nodorum]KAH3973678.1 hypothetical protein HBH51_098800 [Parastagonospora nodorum]KAH4002696.1 hypothetical protein HBI10_075120 [Parastagonospora nodorum]KAH4184357.1 hypothetical protein HBI95_247920 [Parastagonospora nodorum]
MQSGGRETWTGMQSYMSAQVAQREARSEIGCGTAAGGIRRAGCVQSLEGSDSDVTQPMTRDWSLSAGRQCSTSKTP